MATRRTKKKVKKNIPHAIAHVSSSYNNTIITISDVDGKAINWSSAGAIGFKGSKKSTPYAATLTAKAVVKAAVENGVKTINVLLKGTGPGKEAALREFQASQLEVKSVKDITPIPHNGCRKPKSKFDNR